MFGSVVVPCYNESKNIPLILSRFKSAMTRSDIEVILVNNGSVDDSQVVLDHELRHYPFARSVMVPVNQGYGYGILAGLKEARGQFIGWTHADMQTDPADVIAAFNRISELGSSSDLYIKGNRKGRSWIDEFFTMGMAIFETFYLGRFLWDINAQPNVFHRSFFASWKNPPHDFSLDLYALFQAKKQGLKLIRFEVKFPPRIHGHSSWNTGLASKWKFIKRTLVFSGSLKKRVS